MKQKKISGGSKFSGVLAPVFSIPSPFGIGTIGKSAQRWIDFLTRCGQRYWQVLPISALQDCCPYQELSSRAGAFFLIDPEWLHDHKMISNNTFRRFKQADNARVDYSKVKEMQNIILAEAYSNISPEIRKEVEDFSRENGEWLDEYALFMSLKEKYGGQPFFEWEPKAKYRYPKAMEELRTELKDRIEYYKFIQYIFFTQWAETKKYANERGVKIIGDIPMFPSLDSVDVWVHPELFKLKSDYGMLVEAGAPGDSFDSDGQRWGNPVYNYSEMAKTGYTWWINRIKQAKIFYDVIRLDHFIGFVRYYEFPYTSERNEPGHYCNDAPGKELFDAIKAELGEVCYIAEDLGCPGEDTDQLLYELNIPKMLVMAFGMYPSSENPHCIGNIKPDVTYYTGTHDNRPLIGIVNDMSSYDRKNFLHAIGVHENADDREISDAIIRAAFNTSAKLVVVSFTELFALDDKYRMNEPGTVSNMNWSSRIPSGMMNDQKLISNMLKLTREAGRNMD